MASKKPDRRHPLRQAGALVDDDTLDALRAAIYAERGRPEGAQASLPSSAASRLSRVGRSMPLLPDQPIHLHRLQVLE